MRRFANAYSRRVNRTIAEKRVQIVKLGRGVPLHNEQAVFTLKVVDMLTESNGRVPTTRAAFVRDDIVVAETGLIGCRGRNRWE